jgi:hypothetical protein
MIVFPKFILSCFLVLSFFIMILNSHLGDSFFTIFAQTNQGNATNASSGSKATEISNSFSAMGQIGSLVITVPESQFNITNAFEVVLIGEWNLCVRDGSITNFDVNFLASPMDGRRPHIHQITNFESYSDEEPIVLTVEKISW